MPLVDSHIDSASAFLGRLRWPKVRRRSLLPSIVRGAVCSVVFVILANGIQMAACDNLAAVQPSRTFRAGQMKPARLDAVLQKRGIRTIVNLRGHCGEFDWYRDECRVAHDAGVSLEDITLSAIRLPAPSEVRRLIEVLDRAEHPILLHCRQGVDRTGLASVIVKLLEPRTTLATAERQLSLAFGFVPYNGTENMRRFFDLYRDWLTALDVVHSPELFRHWALREYCPGVCRADLGFLNWPSTWRSREARVIRIRVTNTSIQSWVLQPGTLHGIHARFRVNSPDGKTVVDERAGLFDATVRPGVTINLELGVPPLSSGTHTLHVDLIDSDQNAFSQFGFEPALREFTVVDE